MIANAFVIDAVRTPRGRGKPKTGALERSGKATALVTMYIGGGQGVATIPGRV
jgi:acetyl-CoA acetyltransferase